MFRLVNSNGLMVRGTAISGQADFGFVKPNIGIKSETGLMFDKGVEAKLGGAGFKIASDGVEICLFLCVGLGF